MSKNARSKKEKLKQTFFLFWGCIFFWLKNLQQSIYALFVTHKCKKHNFLALFFLKIVFCLLFCLRFLKNLFFFFLERCYTAFRSGCAPPPLRSGSAPPPLHFVTRLSKQKKFCKKMQKRRYQHTHSRLKQNKKCF